MATVAPSRCSLTDRTTLLDCLDFCRGVAIFGVFAVHYLPVGIGWQGVHVFIILSGFGLAYSRLQKKLPWKQWYLRRFKRILPTYWLIAIVGYLVMAGLYLSDGYSLVDALSYPKRVLFLELTLLKSFLHSAVMSMPNVSLWFIPFVVSFYLAFPWLYKFLIARRYTLRGLLAAFGAVVAFEFFYRAAVMYGLDAFPIGGELIFDKVPDGFPFQQEAPFALFFARVGEFGLGMLAAVAYLKHRALFQAKLFSYWTMGVGFAIWLFGNALLSIPFWGWIVSDFVIGLGLILFLINVAALLQAGLPQFFNQVSYLGQMSYYVYLVHYLWISVLTIHISEQLGVQLNLFYATSELSFILGCFTFIFIVAATWLSSHWLQRFDQSKAADWIVRNSVARLLN